jgi:hypothetical protein
MAFSVLWNRNRRNRNFFDFPEPECIRIRIHHKMEYKKTIFLGYIAASNIENARFCTNLSLLINFAKYCLDPELEPEPKLFQIRNRNRNRYKLLPTVPQRWWQYYRNVKNLSFNQLNN